MARLLVEVSAIEKVCLEASWLKEKTRLFIGKPVSVNNSHVLNPLPFALSRNSLQSETTTACRVVIQEVRHFQISMQTA